LKHLKVKPNNSKTILIEGLVLVMLKVYFLFSEILSLLRKQIKSIINKNGNWSWTSCTEGGRASPRKIGKQKLRKFKFKKLQIILIFNCL
jgi:hypothetical protein